MVVVSKPLSESSSFRLAWLTSRRNWMLSYDEATDIKWIRNLFFQVPAGDIYILSSWGSIYPSTTLLENLVFPFRFRTNLRSKLSISYSTSKKLPTRRSISSVGSGAERTAMNGSGAERTAMCAGHSAPSTHPHTILGDWTTYQKIFQI